MGKKIKLTTTADAKPRKRQHIKPCHGCPMLRDSPSGWLGGASPATYRQLLHSDERIDCHLTKAPGVQQCAGAAIFRSNVHKAPRTPDVLLLPRDKGRHVFGTDEEFLTHHLGNNYGK